MDQSTHQFQTVLSLGSVGILIIFILILSYFCVRTRHGIPVTDQLGWANDRAIMLQTAHLSVATGIDEETLDSFPKMIYSKKVCQPFKSAEGKELEEAEDKMCCSICLSDYKDSDVVSVIPDCSHMFHKDCNDEWLRLHATCPLCRTSPRPSGSFNPFAQEAPPTNILTVLDRESIHPFPGFGWGCTLPYPQNSVVFHKALYICLCFLVVYIYCYSPHETDRFIWNQIEIL